MSDAEAVPTPEPPSKEELKKAMKAFRKRLKVTRLDDESRMGYGPMSGGNKSGVVAITPPNQYPKRSGKSWLFKGGCGISDRGCTS